MNILKCYIYEVDFFCPFFAIKLELLNLKNKIILNFAQSIL